MIDLLVFKTFHATWRFTTMFTNRFEYISFNNIWLENL